MKSNVEYWKKKAKALALKEGLPDVKFKPLDKAIFYIKPSQLTGCFSPYHNRITFCTRKYRDRSVLQTLLHELAHAKDFQKRGWIRVYQEHDETFHKEWSKLRRKYLWK